MRHEWLEWRRGGIGASEVAGIMGLSPWASPWSIWANKTGLTKDSDGSEAMEFGNMAEPMLKAYFEKRTGLIVHGEQTWCEHAEHAWMRCTVDGFVTKDLADKNLGTFEAKTTSQPEWSDGVPVHYQCQAQWQMAVTGTTRCYFGVLHLAFGRPTFRIYEFERDDRDIDQLIATCSTFWHDHVLTGTPPATDGSVATTDALNRATWGDDSDLEDSVEADDVTVALLSQLYEARDHKATMEQRIDELSNELKAYMADAATLTAGVTSKGKPRVLATWKHSTRSTFDRSAALAAFPDLALPPYTTATPTRTLLIKTPKD
jgi:putative phage-type endonuclease